MLKKMFNKTSIYQILKQTCIPKKEIITTQIEGIETLQFKNRMDKIKKRSKVKIYSSDNAICKG